MGKGGSSGAELRGCCNNPGMRYGGLGPTGAIEVCEDWSDSASVLKVEPT